MEKETFTDAFKWLQQYHSRKLSKEALKIYWDKLKGITDDQFCDAVQKTYDTNSPGYFPSTEELIKLVIQVKQREYQKQASEPKEQRSPTTPMGKESLALAKRMGLEKTHPLYLSPKQVGIFMMTELETKYPTAGWAAEGHRLIQGINKMQEAMERNDAEQKKIFDEGGKIIR